MVAFNIFCKWIYNNILKTKNRLPIFIIGLHIYITELAFKNYNGKNIWIIIYLSIISVLSLAWETFIPLWTIQITKFSCMTESGFVIYTCITKFINLIAVGLFATSGLPLTYLIPGLPQYILLIFVSLIILINCGFDYIEKKIWNNKKWKIMQKKSEQLEDIIIGDINQINFDNISVDINTAQTTVPLKIIQIIGKICQDVKKLNNDPEILNYNEKKINNYFYRDIDEINNLKTEMSKLFSIYTKTVAIKIIENYKNTGDYNSVDDYITNLSNILSDNVMQLWIDSNTDDTNINTDNINNINNISNNINNNISNNIDNVNDNINDIQLREHIYIP